ncbi:hypothetical protein H5407_20075 [Mitsuaria sp. WAJ17]|uniref:hypothetical protein n=1 Tax=Mitsuaria sp. WAJ17 TaxID=2761452 RepID=UPI0015FF9050|nr:hypothetical protein [Mitsuaria sp. WAJ17]MBB2487539.1 hypothetical protein [Mitsuaria sp. WAJ17]
MRKGDESARHDASTIPAAHFSEPPLDRTEDDFVIRMYTHEFAPTLHWASGVPATA